MREIGMHIGSRHADEAALWTNSPTHDWDIMKQAHIIFSEER